MSCKSTIILKLIKALQEGSDDKIKLILNKVVGPVEYLLSIVNNPEIGHRLKIEASRALLPYLHKQQPKVTELSGTDGQAIKIEHQTARDKLDQLLITSQTDDSQDETVH